MDSGFTHTQTTQVESAVAFSLSAALGQHPAPANTRGITRKSILMASQRHSSHLENSSFSKHVRANAR